MKLENMLTKSIEKFSKEAFELNYSLANNPELSSEEFESSKKIVELLNEHGIKTERNFFGFETAFFGRVIENKNSNVNLAILTEYDALPDVGHGCGHSASAAISVLSALALKDNEHLIDANIDIIGTPDEEVKGIKTSMADGGVFDKYDAVIMVHLSNTSMPNTRFLALQAYEIEFTGKPSHAAASPWDGRSALDGLMLSIHGFDMIRKNLRPMTQVEGIILDGGVATNIIPEKAKGKYRFRSNSSKYLDGELIPWVRDIVEGCAKATQTKSEIKLLDYPYRDMNYLESGTDIIKSVMEDYNIKYEISKAATGSSDIGSVSYRCPAFHPMITITDENVALHTREFAELVKSEKSEQAIYNGSILIDGFIARLLENPDELKKIKIEFNSLK